MSNRKSSDSHRKAISMFGEMTAESFVPFSLNQSQDAMNGEILRRQVTVTDPLGLHMRPLTIFAQKALQFQSSVTVAKQDQRVNGKSPLELMLLAAEQGTDLVLEIEGADAETAMEALAPLLAASTHDDPPDSPLPKKG